MKKKTIGHLIWLILNSLVMYGCFSLVALERTWMRFLGTFFAIFWTIASCRTELLTKKPYIRDYSKYFKKKK